MYGKYLHCSLADACRHAFDLVVLSDVKNIHWCLKADRTDIQTVVEWSIRPVVVLREVFHNAEPCGNTRGKSAYKGVWNHCTCSAGYTQPVSLKSDLRFSTQRNYEGMNISCYTTVSVSASQQLLNKAEHS